ncbi:DUF2891 domain-containing protein [Streptomyces sp. HNM0574]|uniref:DUF2891 domain-containing protein n=1 Tax=Streptomyces sp. HNM0574 TaxID=2714954 RepID=UPI00146C8D47|nr:DUF2891 domain-containing protein [Streptomyces sp. HNM0574]NLU70121.1 DUF2891 domain-containing protein [Streptomyces sp. HNM0574]
MSPDGTGPLGERAANFARLAAENVTREYPNAPAHLVGGPDELIPPRAHHPAFYGAYDWHSSVHMHWLLVRLLRRHPERIEADAVLRVLDAHLTPRALAVEADYLRSHPSFERPYGWAWLLALTAETAALADGDGEPARRARHWHAALAPAARTVDELVRAWLPKATYPVRHGTHANSAFALGLVLDSAERAGVPGLAGPVGAAVRGWYLPDHGAATRWEPSGQDFLSPLLCEADAVRRVLPAAEFARWLTAFLPELGDETAAATGPFLTPPRVSDPADPQIGHLLGLCLSRSAALTHLAGALPDGDARRPVLTAAARTHLGAGLPATTSGDFTTDHWLATFAVLALEG